MSVMTLDIEKPAAGGRMLARHEGRVVLVSGAIPGERVAARLEKAEKGVAFAETVEVLSPSPDRRRAAGDARCGGNVFAHISYSRQLELKGQIIQDGFGRIGHLRIDVPTVIGSPEIGYRMRTRLHVHGRRIGFYLEGTHRLCDAAATGQLLPATSEWISNAQQALTANGLNDVSAVELAENIAGDERAGHLEVSGVDSRRYAVLADGLVGLSLQRKDRREVVTLAGTPSVADTIQVGEAPSHRLHLRRGVRAFFQGNRFLLERLVRSVVGLVPAGPVIDLYAGVGLFGLSLAARGGEAITVVEGDPVSSSDLERNAAAFGGRVTLARSSVERFVAAAPRQDFTHATVIVDPPRTGLSREAIGGIVRLRPPRIVYVSCDVATLARDARALGASGYGLDHVSGIDLFPNTAHVETIAAFTR